MFLTDISTRVPDAATEVRTGEPMTVGIPVPRGQVHDPDRLVLSGPDGVAIPVQWRVLDRWPVDQSIRWLLLDAQLSVPQQYRLDIAEDDRSRSPPPDHGDPIRLARNGRAHTVATAGRSYTIEEGRPELLTVKDDSAGDRHLLLTVVGMDGQPLMLRVARSAEETVGPLRTTLRIEAEVAAPSAIRLKMCGRLSWFAGSRCVRLELTLLNAQRADHPGGYWELGDPGSVLFRDASLVLTGYECEAVFWSEDSGRPPFETAVPASLYQDSSGGTQWQSRVHVDREGKVRVRLRGYELQAPAVQRHGERATPVLWLSPQDGDAALAVRHFWQNFPKALEAGPNRLSIALFPQRFGGAHELQGGEQKTHVVGVAFGSDPIAPRPLDWIVRPSIAAAPPAWYAKARAFPHITPAADAADPVYEGIVHGAIDGPNSFEQKREAIDEYGWRHFGDIYADHETAFAAEGEALVSHYNNQYDAVAGFAAQFMRSGDLRWLTEMDALARHVVDIDIYHTRGDKAAYNGGMFWHTSHYVDAGRASHRAYPRAPGVDGGGPSNEHNYATGLMYHYFLTGHVWAREAAVGLADWVIRMDDGRRTPFRWLSVAATGLASSTYAPTYHGPGRGAGNSIVALLNAFRITGQRAYLEKAETLIHRCVHPGDDIDALELLDVERRWSYTVFLQTLARYLDDKAHHGEIDDRYAYARSALLAYARWMTGHEYPYLEKPEILEYPNETWAAQDMRKCEVFLFAARHSSDAERAQFEERADFFYRASLSHLLRFERRHVARPVVLLLSYGFAYATARHAGGLEAAPQPPANAVFGRPVRFTPQKVIALRRARQLAIFGGVTLLLSAIAMLL
jgi:hypothetical protein